VDGSFPKSGHRIGRYEIAGLLATGGVSRARLDHHARRDVAPAAKTTPPWGIIDVVMAGSEEPGPAEQPAATFRVGPGGAAVVVKF
jgi:hypothetical protein